MLKPEKNIYGCMGKRANGDELCEGDLPIADAMDKLLTTAREQHRNSSLVFKGELNNWGLMGDEKLRETLQRHGTRYAMVLRDNELDRILCMVRDCFWDDLPDGMEQPRYARNISEAECFRGRSKSFMKGEDRKTSVPAPGGKGGGGEGGTDVQNAKPDKARLHLVPDMLNKAIRQQINKKAAEEKAVRELLWQVRLVWQLSSTHAPAPAPPTPPPLPPPLPDPCALPHSVPSPPRPRPTAHPVAGQRLDRPLV